MILKKNLRKLPILEKVLNIFKKFIYIVGLFCFSLTVVILFYYYSSGLQKKFPPVAFIMQVNDKILNKYIGFDIRNTGEYLKIININLFKNFQASDLEKVYLEINQKSILGLELQRKIKSENGGELPDINKSMLGAKVNYQGEKYDVKIRIKGVRQMHWVNKNQTSYKIDIRGNKRLWGMEEFSFQKPITKNYTYEYLFHKLLGHVGLAKIKYFFINLYLNDQDLGVYAVEESFSKELIERQGRRNGPIFSLKDELGEYFPNIAYEVYSKNFWISQHPKLTSDLFSILNNIKNEIFHINDYFDIDKWAKYFAIMDLTGAYHGSLLKSVKLYYNPTTALFEPIGYDLHQGAGIFGNFIVMDFLQEEPRESKIACSWICGHKEWYFRFLKKKNGEINHKFVKKYIEYLKKYSDEDFVSNFLKIYEKELLTYNNAIDRDYSKTDRVRWKGAGFFIYDKNYLLNRAQLIKNRITHTNLKNINISKNNNLLYFEDYSTSSFPVEGKTIECLNKKDSTHFFFAGSMSIKLNTTCKKIRLKDHKGNSIIMDLKNNFNLNADKKIYTKKEFNNLNEIKYVTKISDDEYIVNSNIIIEKNTLIKKDEKIIINKNKTINIKNNSTLFIEGKIIFINDEKNYTKVYSDDGTGSLIFNNNSFEFKNVLFQNLSKPNLDNYILYGGVNFINSKLKLKNIIIKDSNNEDAMNIINSKSELFNIYFNNISADALDVDFGEMNFIGIHCKNINNDCLDVSGANVDGNNLTSINVSDKGLSAGENSDIKIKSMNIVNNYIALAVKDGSTVNLDKITLEKNNYDIAIFNKKKEFLKPKLFISNLNIINKKKIIQSNGTTLLIDNENYYGTMKDSDINLMIY